MACGESTDQGLVLVQKLGDTNIIGYIQQKYINMTGGNMNDIYRQKYIKYKTKYLQLNKTYNINK